MNPNRAATPSTPAAGRTSSALVWNFVLMSFAMLAVFVIKYAIIAPAVTDEENGVFSMLWDLSFAVILFSQSGLQGALLRFIPELEARESGRQISRLYHVVLAAQMAIWAVCLGAILLGGQWTLRKLGLSTMAPLLVAMAFVFLRLLNNSRLSVLQAFRDMKWMSVVTVIGRTLALGAVFVGVAYVFKSADAKVMVCFAALAACDLLTTALTWPTVSRHFRRRGDGHAVVTGRRLIWYASPLLLRSVLVFIEQGQANTLLLGFLGGKELAGYYHLAYYLPFKVVEFVPVAIWPIILATFSAAYTRDPRSLVQGLRLYCKLLFVMLLPLAVGGAIFGDRVILVVSRSRYEAAYLPCQLFFALIALHIFSAPLTVCLHVVEKTWLFVITTAVGAAVNLGLVALLVPWFTDPTWKLVMAVLAVGADWLAVIFIQYWFVKRAAPGFRPPWLDLLRVLCGCLVIVPAVLLKPYVKGPLPLAGAMLLCAALTVVGYRVFRVIDVATVRTILSSRLPLRNALAKALASPAVREAARAHGSQQGHEAL